MTMQRGATFGAGYVCYRLGSRSHLCISDKKNFRYSLCGLRWRRNSPGWLALRWETLSTSSRVTCRTCLDVLSGRTYYKSGVESEG